MFYHVTKRVGSGTHDDPYRPDVPPDVEWAAHIGDTECLVVTSAALSAAAGRVELPNVAALEQVSARLGMAISDVRRWRVS